MTRLVMLALLSALAVAASPAAGTRAAKTRPRRGGTVVVGVASQNEPACFNVWLNRCLGHGWGTFNVQEDQSRPAPPGPTWTISRRSR
jgi:hypothetical protein